VTGLKLHDLRAEAWDAANRAQSAGCFGQMRAAAALCDRARMPRVARLLREHATAERAANASYDRLATALDRMLEPSS
jgi:hypothetical protein